MLEVIVITKYALEVDQLACSPAAKNEFDSGIR